MDAEGLFSRITKPGAPGPGGILPVRRLRGKSFSPPPPEGSDTVVAQVPLDQG